MALNVRPTLHETRRKRSQQQRMFLVHSVLLLLALVIVSRLTELQLLRGTEYHALAQSQHFGGVVLPAKRGEVLSSNSNTGETSILATNTTLDMVYVDPFITDDPTLVAETLADTLVTDDFQDACSGGTDSCPRELAPFYAAAFDPVEKFQKILTGSFLEPLPKELPTVDVSLLPDITEVRRQFARDIERRIAEKRVTFVPLKYGATKVEMDTVAQLAVPGVEVVRDVNLIYANPERIEQSQLTGIARKLADPLGADPSILRTLLRSRPLRYVPIMRRLSPLLSSRLRELQQQSSEKTKARRQQAPTVEAAQEIRDPLWSIAFIPEHWRFYPDGTVASNVVGFLNDNQEAQYGIERTFNPQLRGQEGLIRTVSDPQGGQILTSEQRIVDPRDGDTVVLTIDRTVQREVERLLQEALTTYGAQSGQAIVMEPDTGRIIAMANAPLFDSNQYGSVYKKAPITLTDQQRREIVVELYHPDTRQFILKAYYNDVFTSEARALLSEQKQQDLADLETLYDLQKIVRYYVYIGENFRFEVFPTEQSEIWLRYENNLGVGAYLNRTVQEIYEPGSVMKPITMSIAIDQGEVIPTDTYLDEKPVEVDEYTIKNALNRYYGKVTLTDCLAFSINTCMTSVSSKLGKKLFHHMILRFGFGRITGIELEDELPGDVLPWRQWSNALLATSAYGQGISATPLQVVTAINAIANGGKLMRPLIVDSIRHSDGTVETSTPHVIDQVITSETAETVTAMLVVGVETGYAKPGRVPGYRLAGKTGTSQIAGPGGKYEVGTGSVINSFVGYGPIHDPAFTIFVKFDRPTKVSFGSESAAPIFKNIATFLLKYYGIPPDER